MNDPIDRALKELTEDRSGFVDDLRQLEMAVWVGDDDELREERGEDETEDGDD